MYKFGPNDDPKFRRELVWIFGDTQNDEALSVDETTVFAIVKGWNVNGISNTCTPSSPKRKLKMADSSWKPVPQNWGGFQLIARQNPMCISPDLPRFLAFFGPRITQKKKSRDLARPSWVIDRAAWSPKRRIGG